jgi:predicted AAA+ superfamily ATPase
MDDSLFIPREDVIRKIRPFIGKGVVKIIAGIRRCGKSVVLKLIQRELAAGGVAEANIIALNFDTFESHAGTTAEAVYREIKARTRKAAGKVYVFLDEIQVLPGWEKLANSCLAELDADLFISGSNAKMLSPEYATFLGGRYVLFTIYPFCFKEALAALAFYGRTVTVKEAFAHYLIYGGMPFIYQLNAQNPGVDDFSIRQYLSDITDSIIVKDITARYHVRDVDLLKRIILFLFSNIGRNFSVSAVQKYLKNERRTISWETIYNYIDYCKTACLLLPVKQERILGKQLLKTNEKIYLTDHGLREAVYGNNRRDIQQILENMVYLELLRNGYEVAVGKINGREIDFAAHRNNETVYIQTAYLLASPGTVEREFSVYDQVKDHFPKYVLSLDEFDLSRKGVRHVNLIDFLAAPPGVYL